MKVKISEISEAPPLPKLDAGPDAEPVAQRRTLFDTGERRDTPVYRRDALVAGQGLDGPAIVEQLDTTILVFPGDRCVVDEWGNLIITPAQGSGS